MNCVTQPFANAPRPASVSLEDWTDWGWQMRNRVRSVEGLGEWVAVSEDERRAIEALEGHFQFQITPYFRGLR